MKVALELGMGTDGGGIYWKHRVKGNLVRLPTEIRNGLEAVGKAVLAIQRQELNRAVFYCFVEAEPANNGGVFN